MGGLHLLMLAPGERNYVREMSDTAVIVSKPNPAAALAYLADRLDGSPLYEFLGRETLAFQCARIAVITASLPAAGTSFDASFGGRAGPCDQWLAQTGVTHLRSAGSAAVLFEDPISSLSDPNLQADRHAPFWFYKERIFLPVLAEQANGDHVARAMAWVAGFHQMAYFVEVPTELRSAGKATSLSEAHFRTIAASITRIAIDIFDGEGYMEWVRAGSATQSNTRGEAAVGGGDNPAGFPA